MASRYFQAIKGSLSANELEDYDCSLLITGVTGSGKSSLCSFLCCDDDTFISKPGFASVTANSSAGTVTLQGKRVKLIDTPGFCDDYETDQKHMEQFGEGIFSARKGVNAVGLAINAGNRFTKNDSKVIKEISDISNLWPYTFIIFTHADYLEGNTENERRRTLNNNLSNERCPITLKEYMKLVNNRYILIDSTNKTEEYHRLKVGEILGVIDQIFTINDYKLYTNELFNKAKEIEKKILADKLEIGRKKYMAEVTAKFEGEAAKQAEIKAQDERAREQLAFQKIAYLERKISNEQLPFQKKGEEKLEHLENELQNLQEQKANFETDIAKMKLKAYDPQRKAEENALKEAANSVMSQLNTLREHNAELLKRSDKSWYKFLSKKWTGKECVIQ